MALGRWRHCVIGWAALLGLDAKSRIASRVQAALNKGEARNALARAVLFNHFGEIRERSFGNRCYRASGFNLIVAAIILWNTVYLEKASKTVGNQQDGPTEYPANLSPLYWNQINLTGDYTWRL